MSTNEDATAPTAVPIEAAAPEDVPEDEFDELDWDAQSSDSTSVTSSVLQHSFENGRRYHHYRHGRYPIPNDDIEQGRDALKHVVALELLDGKLTTADIGDSPQKILDLGTGTGTWAMDIADQYPSAEILGTDLSPVQPSWVPPNVKFMVDDMEDEWVQGDGWDLIHVRHVFPALKARETVCKMAFENLRPGGFFESQDFGGIAKCDDGTMREGSGFARFMDLSQTALAKFGMNFRSANEGERLLSEAGFVNIQCRTIKTPVGPWPKDPTLRLIGKYMVTVMSDLMGAFAAKPFRGLGMEQAEIEVFLAEARRDLSDTKQHHYLDFKIWTGQKPTSDKE